MKEDALLEDSTTRSDTDTSRADGSVAGDGKSQEPMKLAKKFSTKPISFAKYSVPKVITASSTSKVIADKGKSVRAGVVPDSNPDFSNYSKLFGVICTTIWTPPTCSEINEFHSAKAKSISPYCPRPYASLE